MKTTKQILASSAPFTSIVEALRALASDPNADPDEAAKAEKALQALADDPAQSASKRNSAYQAVRRVEEAVALRQKMGLSANRPGVNHEGCVSSFRVMTRDEAQRALAKKR